MYEIIYYKDKVLINAYFYTFFMTYKEFMKYKIYNDSNFAFKENP